MWHPKFSIAGQGRDVAACPQLVTLLAGGRGCQPRALGTLGTIPAVSVQSHCVLQFNPLAKSSWHPDTWKWSILGCATWLFFFFPVLCLVPLSWKQTQDEAKHLDLNPQTKPWPSSYSSSHRKLEYCPWNEQRICFWIVTFAAGGSLI